MIMSFCFYHEQPYELGQLCPDCEREVYEEEHKHSDDYYLESDREFVAELMRIDL